MSFNSRHASLQQGTGTVALSGSITAGTTITGPTFSAANSEPGTIQALVTLTIATGSLTLAPRWQGSEDGTNWYTITGTPVTAVTATATSFIQGPIGSWRYLRIAILTAGATAGASDSYAIQYSYDKPRYLGS